MSEKEIKYAKSFKEQFTLRGIFIGIVGAIIITTSSMYVALKMGALPWPIIFVALVSMFSLKAMGKTNINEINVTHTIMSAGAMVAGGIAFTIPGIWMLNPNAVVKFLPLVVVSLSGVILGLIFTALIRKYFIETKALPYPMGQAAAETLIVGDQGGKKSALLFGSMGFAAVWTIIRDGFGKIPALLTGGIAVPGISLGIYMSPMMLSVGYLIGPVFLSVWFLGALIGDIGVVWGGTAAGLWNLDVALGIKSSLGMGVMVGTGLGIIVKGILPQAKAIFGPMFSKEKRGDAIINLRWAPFVLVLLAFALTFILHMGIIASIITILGVWLCTSMSAQIVGQSGINPMEVFGVIVLLAAKAASSIGQVEAFFVAAVVAVACGLVGDIMNDFKAGHIVKSNPKAQWLGEVIGGVIGSVVSIGVLFILINAYGISAFGSEILPAPQAGVVAAMVGGIPNLPAFWLGLGAGTVLYILGLPVMTLGLGIYLPFYLSFTAFLGGMVRLVLDKVKPQWGKNGGGLIVASGLLGGEAVVGVIIALIMVVMGMGAL